MNRMNLRSSSGKDDKITSICYVEVNNHDIRNVGKYLLKDGKQMFDVAIIFAANINYDIVSKTATLFCNEQVQKVLDNRITHIKSLQKKGIKVLLSLLGNHCGTGVCNFPDKGSASNFARKVSDLVSKYGLDGIDIDDEYAGYGEEGKPDQTPVNEFSFCYFVSALRDLMPNKLITMYFIGDATRHLTYEENHNANATATNNLRISTHYNVGTLIDYSWNPYYNGSFAPPDIPPMTRRQLSGAAIDCTSNTKETVADLAEKTVIEGYGVFMWYNLTEADTAELLTSGSEILYNQTCEYKSEEKLTSVQSKKRKLRKI